MVDQEEEGEPVEVDMGPEVAHLAVWIDRLPSSEGSPMEVSIDDGRPPSMLAMVRACSALARAVHVARTGNVGSEEDHALVVAEAVNGCMATTSTVRVCEPSRVPDFLVTQHVHGLSTAFSPLMTEGELSALMLQVFRTVYRAAQKACVVFDREEFAVWVQRMAVQEDETEVG